MKRGLEIGRVGRARGLRGEVLVHMMNRHSELLGPGKVIRIGSDWESTEAWAINQVRPHSSGAAVFFEGVADRTAAEALRGLLLFVDWENLPALEEDEFYYEELRGFDVVHVDGTPIGTVVGLFETNADMLVVRGKDREHYIPVLDGFVTSIDRKARRIDVNPPEGLLELP